MHGTRPAYDKLHCIAVGRCRGFSRSDSMQRACYVVEGVISSVPPLYINLLYLLEGESISLKESFSAAILLLQHAFLLLQHTTACPHQKSLKQRLAAELLLC